MQTYLSCQALSIADPILGCSPTVLKTQCTGGRRRYVSRHAPEEAFERMERRMQAHPEMMVSEDPSWSIPSATLNNGYLATLAS